MSKRSSTLKSIFSIFLCSLLAFSNVSALSEDQIKFYNQNNIIFYDGEGYSRSCTKLANTDAMSIIWNFLSEQGFSDEQIAGILGNAKIESGLNPVIKSSSNYWGLFQWDETNRWPKIKYAIEEAGLSNYLTEEYWSAGGDANIPLEDLETLLTIELEAALEENEQRNNWVDKIKTADSPKEASDIFLVLFEGAVGGTGSVIEYYDEYNGQPYQNADMRRSAAQNYYDTYSSSQYCATNPHDPLAYIQQYILDTNATYGFNYTVPQNYIINQLINSPLDDTPTLTGNCWGATYCGQCTAISGWFVINFTSYTYGGGDGGDVVNNLIINNPGLSSSNSPTVFSIFSTHSTSSYGHTGLVLDVLDSGEIITLENHMGKKGSSSEYSLKVHQFTPDNSYIFVDLSAEVSLDHLGA